MRIKSGIILTGGSGSRLSPLNTVINNHLIPVYNKFIIDYPLETLKQIGINNLTVVLGGLHFDQIVSHIKDGNHLGMSVNYIYQEKPIGIAQAISLCEPFINDNKFVTILGNNIFENSIKFIDSNKSAQIVLHNHPELHRFGVATFHEKMLIGITEKPRILNNDNGYENFAITGAYLFDKKFFNYFRKLRPSDRGEFEITDIIRLYATDNELDFSYVDGFWSDAGNHESINIINNFFFNKGRL